MTGKEYLAEFKNLNRSIEQMQEYIQELRERSVSISHPLQEIVVQHTPQHDKLADWASRIVDAEDQLVELSNQRIDMYSAIFKKIVEIPDLNQQSIMMARYLQLMKYDDVACDTGFSIQYVYELHSKGLKAFEKVFEGSEPA